MDVFNRIRSVLADRYEIEGEIGAGGMATVYLARDLKHQRKVAVKVLRPELAAVLGSERFLAEINVTANLQHPHLLPLFDSGEADGLLYYVMPYIEGESLRERLSRERQLPIDEAVRITTAVAGALQYAHRHGVIHRDLKPENILLNEAEPLVADFGIALAITIAGGARVTQTGLPLGTPQYMSPEQATGDRQLDARSDIYSLAAVLYEMLTGDPPHAGSTTQAIIAKVLTDRPQSVRAHRDTVPVYVDAAIQSALAKLPADRFASAEAFSNALVNLGQFPGVTRVQRASGSRSGRRPVVLGIAGLSFVVLLAVAGLTLTPFDRTAHPSTIFTITFGDSVTPTAPGHFDLSQDGSALAFTGQRKGVAGVFLRKLDSFDVRLIPGTERGINPRFSPDGKSLSFTVAGKLKKVSLTNGVVVDLADSIAGKAAWLENGDIVFGTNLAAGYTIKRITTAGGKPAIIATPDQSQGHVAYGLPEALPGGKKMLITLWKGVTGPGAAELAVLDLKSGQVTELGISGFAPRVAGQHVLFVQRSGTLVAAPLSSLRRAITTPHVPIMSEILVSAIGSAEIAVGTDGTLIYRSGVTSLDLVKVDNDGSRTKLFNVDALLTPRSSPDGKRVAIERAGNIWTYDFKTGTQTPLTNDNRSWRPEWSHDGRHIAHTHYADGNTRVEGDFDYWWRPANGSGAATSFVKSSIQLSDISFGVNYVAVRQREDILISTQARAIFDDTRNRDPPQVIASR